MAWTPEEAKSELTLAYLQDMSKRFPSKEIMTKEGKSTGNFRTSLMRLDYHDLFEARANTEEPGSTPKFSATLLGLPWDDMAAIKTAVKSLVAEKWGEDPPEALKLPVRRQRDKKEKPGYLHDGLFIAPKAGIKSPPEILDRKTGALLTDQSAIYKGCWVLAVVRPYAYGVTPEERKKTKGGFGVTLQLKNIIKVCDDLPLAAGSVKGSDAFADLLEGQDTDYSGLM